MRRGRERPECSQGRQARALLLAQGAHQASEAGDAPPRLPAAEVSESVKRPLAPRERRTSPGAVRPRPGREEAQDVGPPGLAVSLALARRACTIRPGLGFAAHTAQSTFFRGSSEKKWECHWNLVGLASGWRQTAAGREGRRLGPRSLRLVKARLSWPGEYISG